MSNKEKTQNKPEDSSVNSVDLSVLLARENLCWFDRRNPNYADNYTAFDAEDIPDARVNPCYCDNCMHGRDELALEILRLQNLS